MNGEDQFEQRLQGLPPRPVPSAWRAEVLAAARAAVPVRPSTPDTRHSTLISLLSAWLWPHPRAWAGLAAVWLLVLGLNFADREPSRTAATQPVAPPSPQMRELLRQQEQLLAELVGPRDEPVATRPKPAAAQPRSERRADFTCV